MPDDDLRASLAEALDATEHELLGARPHLTRAEVAEQADVDPETATELWRLLGFPSAADDERAFTEADVAALRRAQELVDLGILGPERQAALVRTWGRSFARLAEWQTALLADVALERGDDPAQALRELTQEVLPRVEELQTYVWRRHLTSAGSRLLAVTEPGGSASRVAVGFVDIVGYTARSKELDDVELVAWLEGFESRATALVVEGGGRIIKNIGDEVLFVCDDAASAVDVALELAARGEDEDDEFPRVRAGVALGEVVSRLGDVYGPVVNIASRLTSAARPGTVLIDGDTHAALHGDGPGDDTSDDSAGEQERGSEDQPEGAHERYSFRRLRRLSVKGYSRLEAWVVRRR